MHDAVLIEMPQTVDSAVLALLVSLSSSMDWQTQVSLDGPFRLFARHRHQNKKQK